MRTRDRRPRGGKCCFPAFHDSHAHPVAGGIDSLEVDLHGIETPEEVLEKIRAYAAAHPDAAWVRGSGWELPTFPNANPTRSCWTARSRSSGLPVRDGRPLRVGQLEGAGDRRRHEGHARSAARAHRAGPEDGRAVGRAPRRGDRARLPALSRNGRRGTTRTASRRAEDRERLRADVAAGGERLDGGSRRIRRGGRARDPDRSRSSRRSTATPTRASPRVPGSSRCARGIAADAASAPEASRSSRTASSRRRRRPCSSRTSARTATAARRTSSPPPSAISRRRWTRRASRSTSTPSAIARSATPSTRSEAARRRTGPATRAITSRTSS
jgi:hypothetical protein